MTPELAVQVDLVRPAERAALARRVARTRQTASVGKPTTFRLIALTAVPAPIVGSKPQDGQRPRACRSGRRLDALRFSPRFG